MLFASGGISSTEPQTVRRDAYEYTRHGHVFGTILLQFNSRLQELDATARATSPSQNNPYFYLIVLESCAGGVDEFSPV